MKDRYLIFAFFLWISSIVEGTAGIIAQSIMEPKKYGTSFFSVYLPWIFVGTLLLSFFVFVFSAIWEYIRGNGRR